MDKYCFRSYLIAIFHSSFHLYNINMFYDKNKIKHVRYIRLYAIPIMIEENDTNKKCILIKSVLFITTSILSDKIG